MEIITYLAGVIAGSVAPKNAIAKPGCTMKETKKSRIKAEDVYNRFQGD